MTFQPWSETSPPEDVYYFDETKKRYIIREFDADNNIVGFIEVHQHNNTECVGSVALKGGQWAERNRGWTMEGEWPEITLSPSILCTRCNNHGYVVKGKWVAC